jgi:transposase-like protein
MLTTEPGTAKPDPEVLAIARRRQFTAEYKRSFLREYEASPKGERGALLRREGLYSSHVDAWRKQQGAGALAGLSPKKRGRKPTKRRDEVAVENQRLARQVARLEHQLAHARKVIEVQKKISEILGVDQTLPDELKDDET